MPTAGAIGSLLLLALLGTALAQLILFRIVGLFGARRLSLVTYLLPGFALVYGALILDERVNGSALIGLALILLGVALGSGSLRLRRRRVGRQRDDPDRLGSRPGTRGTSRSGCGRPSSAGSRAGRARSPRGGRRCGRARGRGPRRCRSRRRSAARSASRAPARPDRARSPRAPRSRRLSSAGSPLMPPSTHLQLGPILLLDVPRSRVRGRFRMAELEGLPREAVPVDPRREPLTVTHCSAPPGGCCVVCIKVYRQVVRKPCAPFATGLEPG